MALVMAIMLPGTASANDSKYYGPFASESPDSITCGNTCATDYFDRSFQVLKHPNDDGTYTVYEQFENGSFVTMAGSSAAGCD